MAPSSASRRRPQRAPPLSPWAPALGLLLAALSLAASAQVCRWVDETGRTHFADHCPPGVKGEIVTLEPGPPEERVEEARQQSRALRERVGREEAAPAGAEASTGAAPQGLPSLSPEDVRCPRAGLSDYVRRMELACERARERQIAPLRQAQVERCVAEGGGRSACEREYADFMNPRYVGRLELRAFDFLPECVIARTCRERAGMEVDGRRERVERRRPR